MIVLVQELKSHACVFKRMPPFSSVHLTVMVVMNPCLLLFLNTERNQLVEMVPFMQRKFCLFPNVFVSEPQRDIMFLSTLNFLEADKFGVTGRLKLEHVNTIVICLCNNGYELAVTSCILRMKTDLKSDRWFVKNRLQSRRITCVVGLAPAAGSIEGG